MLLFRSVGISVLLAFNLLFIACGNGGQPATGVSPTAHPLVAQYAVQSGQAGQAVVEFGPDTNYGYQTAAYDIAPFTTLPILVAGMKPSTTYHMRAKVLVGGNVFWTDQDRTFTTQALGALPVPAMTVTRNPALGTENGGVEMMAFAPPAGSPPVLETFVTDRDGNPLWFYNPPGRVPSYLKLMPNGHFLVAVAGGNNATDSSEIREVDLAGNVIRSLDAPTLQQALQNAGYNFNFVFFHHDFAPLDNGHVIIIGQTTKDFTDLPGYPGVTTVQGDVIVDLDQTWNPVWAWNAFDHLDVNRHLMGLPDWTHSNAIVYNPADGNLMLSVRHQSWILGIDYRDGAGAGDVLWRLGQAGDFSIAGGDPSQWFYAEHFPSLISSSGTQVTLSVFDNGNLRVEDLLGTTCGAPPAIACFSRATVFQFDQSALQAQVQWQFAPGFFSPWGGAINQLPNGNVEFEMSAPFPPPMLGSRVMEVTQTATPQVIWQMDLLGGNSYRTYRIPSLYPGVSWP